MAEPLIVVMAGGTGGHIFPALATVDQLRAQGWRAHWLGTPGSMEADLVPKQGIEISLLPVTGLRGKGLLTRLLGPLRIALSVFKAWRLLRRLKPDVVLGMGGYVAGPGGVAAKLLGIPLVIHEQNAVAGLTNRLLAQVADRVLTAFPATLPSRLCPVVTGNPVRAAIGAPEAASECFEGGRPLRLLVVGGSLGAAAINQVVPELIQALPGQLEVQHQTGQRDLEATRKRYGELGVTAEVVPFIEDMAAAYARADLVLCRAGALTVAELANAGKPAILVPYPHAVDDHQTANARYLVDQGGAVLVPQAQLNLQQLVQLLQQYLDQPQTLAAMARAARAQGKLDAAAVVAQMCKEARRG